MQCPECQFENREGAKFCNECGHKFDVTCPECSASNRVGSKFCDECGHKLISKPTALPKELSFDQKIAKIQKYLPKGLTEKILSQKDKIEGERKHVTVMFCDMAGYTSLTLRFQKNLVVKRPIPSWIRFMKSLFTRFMTTRVR